MFHQFFKHILNVWFKICENLPKTFLENGLKVPRKHKVYFFWFKCPTDLPILQAENLKILNWQKKCDWWCELWFCLSLFPCWLFPQNLLFSGPDMQYNNFHTFLGVPKYVSAKSWSGVFNIYKLTIALKIRKVPGKFHIPMLLQVTLDMCLLD